MKIEAGKYYRTRSGSVAGPVTAITEESYHNDVWGSSYNSYQSDGRVLANEDNDDDLVSEVQVTDVLPFTLRAGVKFDTVKPDGSPGPVVKLSKADQTTDGLKVAVPFCGETDVETYEVTRGGECHVFYDRGNVKDPFLRIVREHVENPTPIERLEKTIDKMNKLPTPLDFVPEQSRFVNELKGVLSDLKASQAK